MDELLAKLSNEENTYLGQIIVEPFWTNDLITSYGLSVRPLKRNLRQIQQGTAELLLNSGQILPVVVIGFATISPTPEAKQTGAWKPLDESIYIRDTDLTQEQAQQARFFVQRQASDK